MNFRELQSSRVPEFQSSRGLQLCFLEVANAKTCIGWGHFRSHGFSFVLVVTFPVEEKIVVGENKIDASKDEFLREFAGYSVPEFIYIVSDCL